MKKQLEAKKKQEGVDTTVKKEALSKKQKKDAEYQQKVIARSRAESMNEVEVVEEQVEETP